MSVVPLGRYVLLVDDDPVILRGYGQRLRAEGFDVTTAADGYEALTAAAQRAWDVILLDLRIPYRNGIEVLRVLRSRKETAATPVYVLAQPGDADFVDRALREGADGMFEKARLAPRDLVAEVQAIIDGRRRSVRPQPASSAVAAPGVPVPAAVDEIAMRFRKDAPPSVRPVPRPAASVQASMSASMSPGLSPAASVRPQRPAFDDMEMASATGSRQGAPALPPAASLGGSGTTARPAGGFDVVLNRMVGQPGQLAAALGLPGDYSCPICTGSLVLRLEPDPSIEFGVRGHFFCPRCMQ